MNTWMRIVSGTLVAGGIMAVGLGAATFAVSTGPHYWCPGQTMPISNPPLAWDMTVCHQYHQISAGKFAEGPTPGSS